VQYVALVITQSLFARSCTAGRWRQYRFACRPNDVRNHQLLLIGRSKRMVLEYAGIAREYRPQLFVVVAWHSIEQGLAPVTDPNAPSRAEFQESPYP